MALILALVLEDLVGTVASIATVLLLAAVAVRVSKNRRSPEARARGGQSQARDRSLAAEATSTNSIGGDSLSQVDLTILMPAFNEAPTVHEAIRRVLDSDFGGASTELIVVDDGSTDGSHELISNNGFRGAVKLVRHDHNAGKGAAVHTGLAHASGRYVAVIDADLEYDPADTARMLEPLLAGRADAVFGVRRYGSSPNLLYLFGNKGINFSTNLLYTGRIADVTCCQKVMPTELLRSLPLREPRFGFETELTARLLRRRARIVEIPVSYEARSHSEGKKLTTLDGMTVIRTLLRCRFDRAGSRPRQSSPGQGMIRPLPADGRDSPAGATSPV